MEKNDIVDHKDMGNEVIKHMKDNDDKKVEITANAGGVFIFIKQKNNMKTN